MKILPARGFFPIQRLVAASLFVGATTVAAPAISGPAAPVAPTQIQAESQVSDEQVKSFADAQTRVNEISQKWQAQLSGQETESELQEVQDKARQEMVIAVQNTGLSLQEYNQIAMAAQADATLQERIRAAMTRG